jgi:Putative Actinobacterial Holin-X, holin superfamily III
VKPLVTRVDSVNVSAEVTNWPQLLSKTVDDLSRIARTEMELLELTLRRLIEEQADKIIGLLFLLVALSYGCLLLLGSIVLLIHLWLAWWLSLLIAGIVITSAGILFWRMMTAAARKRSA